jgi:hypothetical protein
MLRRPHQNHAAMAAETTAPVRESQRMAVSRAFGTPVVEGSSRGHGCSAVNSSTPPR